MQTAATRRQGSWLLLLASVLTVGTAWGGGQAAAGATGPRPDATVTIASKAAQRVDHFGASGAWWPNDLVMFPPAVQHRVADLLFGADGIELSGYRYNIGGGGVGVTNPTRAPQTFLVAPGRYDWTRDPGGLTFARAAAHDHVPELTGFVNSAPTAWTTDARNCGGGLTPGAEAAYSRYLADVVEHLHAEHVDLAYVSPMNEPDDSFASCGQEGMSVPVAQRGALVRATGAALARQSPWARVIADESSWAFAQFLPEVPRWLDPTTTPFVAALAHHAYDFPTDAWLAEVATLARFGHPLWMTEICCYDGKGPLVGFGAQYDPTITSGLWLAHTIWQDLTITGDSAFDWWTALSPELGCDPTRDRTCASTLNTKGWNDGLLYYDPGFRSNGDFAVTTTKRFFVLGNFSRFVRPGARRHDVTGTPPGVETLAFSRGRDWVVVVINENAAARPAARIRLVLPEGAGRLRSLRAVQTSATRDLASVHRPRRRGDRTFDAVSPAQSVTTYTFRASAR